jgi:WD40 repeat protein
VFHPSGEMLLTSAADGALRLWRLPDGALLETLRGHDGEILSLAVSGARAATGGSDYRVVVWDLAAREPVLRLDEREQVYALSYSHDGERLIVAPLSNRIVVCDPRPLRERVGGQ